MATISQRQQQQAEREELERLARRLEVMASQTYVNWDNADLLHRIGWASAKIIRNWFSK